MYINNKRQIIVDRIIIYILHLRFMKTLSESILSKHKVNSSAIEDARVTSEICDLYCDTGTNRPRDSKEWTRFRQLIKNEWFSISRDVLICNELWGSDVPFDFMQLVHEQCGINTIRFNFSFKTLRISKNRNNTKNTPTIDGMKFEVPGPVDISIDYPVKFINCAFVNIHRGGAVSVKWMGFHLLPLSESVFKNCKFENMYFLSEIALLDKHVINCDFNDKCVIRINHGVQYVKDKDRKLFDNLVILGVIDLVKIAFTTYHTYKWSLSQLQDKKTYILDPKKTYKDFADLILPGNNVPSGTSIILGDEYNNIYITRHKPPRHVLTSSLYKKVQLHDGTWVYEKKIGY